MWSPTGGFCPLEAAGQRGLSTKRDILAHLRISQGGALHGLALRRLLPDHGRGPGLQMSLGPRSDGLLTKVHADHSEKDLTVGLVLEYWGRKPSSSIPMQLEPSRW